MNMQTIIGLRTKARNLLRDHWVQSQWVVDPETMDEWISHGTGDDVSMLRGWLRVRDLWDGKRYYGECVMCAEGAVWLAAATDPTKTDIEAQRDAERLIEHMQKKLTDVGGWMTIPDYNDSGAESEAEIIKTLFKD